MNGIVNICILNFFFVLQNIENQYFNMKTSIKLL